MSKKTHHCLIDNISVVLPKYLNTHSKHKSNPEKYAGKWRYRSGIGKAPQDITKFLTGEYPDKIGVTLVMEMVTELNRKYHPEELIDKPSVANKSSLLCQFNKFKTHYASNTKKNWVDIDSVCTRFCEAVGTTPLHKLDKQTLQEALYTFKPNAQKKMKTCMTAFFADHILEYDFCPNFTDNPFMPNGRSSLKFTSLELAKTNRLRMRKSDVRSMIAKAENNNQTWLVDALKISFLLGLRCSDIMNMKWDTYRVKSNSILIPINKSINALGTSRGVSLLITRESHPEVMDIIRMRYLNRGVVLKNARTRYGVHMHDAIVETAEYVFYRKPDFVPNEVPKGKEQITQIDGKYYSRQFKNFRDKCPDITTRMQEEQGYICLHEIRSLFARIALVKKTPIEDIREALAHQGGSKGALETHYLDGKQVSPKCMVTLADLHGPEIDNKFHDFGEIDEAVGAENG